MKKVTYKALKHYRFLNKGSLTKSTEKLSLFFKNEKEIQKSQNVKIKK